MSAAVQLYEQRPPALRFEETGPGTLAGRYLRKFWHPIAIASQLLPGRALPIHVLGESFTLYRTSDGSCYLTEYRCPHRRTQLNTGWVESDGLRCRYHGWKFGTDGQCLEIPGEGNPSHAKRIRLRMYPVREYLGLIFGYFGDGEPPELPRYTAFDEAGYLDVSTYTRECNYFQNLENGVDEVHVNFTHAVGLFENSGLNDEVPQVETEETTYGLVAKGIRSGGRVRETHLLMPNILMLKLPPSVEEERSWRNYISWRVPINDHVHRTFIVLGIDIHGDAKQRLIEAKLREEEEIARLEPMKDVAHKILAGEMTLEEAGRRPDITGIQDYVTQVGQDVIVDRGRSGLGVPTWHRSAASHLGARADCIAGGQAADAVAGARQAAGNQRAVSCAVPPGRVARRVRPCFSSFRTLQAITTEDLWASL